MLNYSVAELREILRFVEQKWSIFVLGIKIVYL